MPSLSPTVAGIQSTALLLLSVSSLICNALVGYVLSKKPELLSHSSSKLLLNLSASSFLFTFTVLPFVFASSVKQRWIFGDFWCQASGFLNVLFSATSLGTVMFLSIDRYHCIVNPLNYANRMSPCRTRSFILCTWGASLFLASLPLLDWGKYGYQSAKVSCTVVWSDTLSQGYTKLYSLTLFLPLLVMLYTYYHIVKAARRQARVGPLAALPASIMGPRTNRSSIASNSSAFSGAKALRTTFLVLGTVIFCWLPYVTAILLESEKVQVRYELQTTFVMVSYLSSLSYPVIYGFHIRAIRRNIKRLLASLFCGNQNRVRPASDAGFVIPTQVGPRNRSVSQGSVNSFDMAYWSPRRESESMWSLPVIKEEIENVANATRSTDLTTDGDVCNLPGSCV